MLQFHLIVRIFTRTKLFSHHSNKIFVFSQVPLHNMTGLKILNVSHNELERVPKNTFPKLYELHTVDLSHNRIEEIWNGVFQTLFSLRFLNLSNNNLGELRSSALGAIPTLLEMDMSYNNLTEVGRGSFARLSSLRFLNISHNSLNKIFQVPASLSHLDMSHNAFTNLGGGEESPWPSMNALLSLDMSNNLLTSSGLPRGAFGNLLTLQSLDLSSNMLESPPRDALGDLSALQKLLMRNNSVKTLERGAFGRLPVVFDLDLSYNGLNNVSLKAFDGMLQLLHLKLNNNNISSLAPGVLFGKFILRKIILQSSATDRQPLCTSVWSVAYHFPPSFASQYFCLSRFTTINCVRSSRHILLLAVLFETYFQSLGAIMSAFSKNRLLLVLIIIAFFRPCFFAFSGHL